LSRLTREGWIDRHAYLRGIAEVSARVDRAAARVSGYVAPMPAWDGQQDEFFAGVPLLQSSNVVIDLEPVGRSVIAMVERLATDAAAERTAAEAAALASELEHDHDAPGRIVSWLLGDESWTPVVPGLLRLLAWTAMRKHLAPLVDGFARWRDEERWLRNYCPLCGLGPGMAQLIGKDPGRKRFLVCGRCASRWQYKRTRCPYCEHDVDRTSILAIEGEGGLRIDHCESCLGYVKTYDGEGDEDLLLADWTSLHLDLLAVGRGWKRRASSLYELPPDAAPAENTL
jgi:FdhE protein